MQAAGKNMFFLQKISSSIKTINEQKCMLLSSIRYHFADDTNLIFLVKDWELFDLSSIMNQSIYTMVNKHSLKEINTEMIIFGSSLK